MRIEFPIERISSSGSLALSLHRKEKSMPQFLKPVAGAVVFVDVVVVVVVVDVVDVVVVVVVDVVEVVEIVVVEVVVVVVCSANVAMEKSFIPRLLIL